VRDSVKTTSQLLAVGRSYNPKGGAPPGNRNALKTGQHTGRNRALRRQVTTFIRNARAVAAMVEAQVKARGPRGIDP
jgi:hypothetical protein